MNLPRTPPAAVDLLPGKTNYYAGADPSGWRTGVPNYARVRYQSVFRGVDLAVYGNQREVEYDWLVAPGADPSLIRFSFTGARRMRVDAAGDLALETAGGEIRHRKPCVYQMVDGHRREISGGFVLARNGQVGFHVGAYDRRRALVIDPQLIYAAGFGGSGTVIPYGYPQPETFSDTPSVMALDAAGNVYVTGTTYSGNFPLVNSFAHSEPGDNVGTFVSKLSADGGTLLYSTYVTLGGAALAGRPLPTALAVDGAGNAYVTGTTCSTAAAAADTCSIADLPVLGNGGVATAGDADAFLLALNPDGTLQTTLVFGGSGADEGTSIALGPDGDLYLAGVTSSPNFPVTPGAYRSTPLTSQEPSIFLMKINPRVLNDNFPGSTPIEYATYLGPAQLFVGPGSVTGSAPVVVADNAGNAYVAASTDYAAWPVSPGAAQPQCAGQTCAIVAKLNSGGNQLLYATYFGGSGEQGVGGLAIDASGNAYLSGTTSSTDLPVTSGAFQTTWSSVSANQYPIYTPQTAFVAKLNANATKFVYATYLGGTVQETGNGIAVDSAGNAYVAGATVSPDFPILNALQVSLANSPYVVYMGSSVPTGSYQPSAGFLSVLNPAGSALVWSTFLGSPTALPSIVTQGALVSNNAAYAVALDSAGNVYVTGLGIDVTGSILTGSASDAAGVMKIAPQGNPLQFVADGITNAASFNPGLPAPGGLASLFLHGLNVSGIVVASGDPLPTQLEGVSILVDGTPAPILAVANIPVANPVGLQQINFQVPFQAATNEVEVRYRGSSTFVLPQQVAPGIFTFGDGSGAIEHSADYSLVTASNPAAPGEIVLVYATGLGPVSGNIADGVPAPGASAIQPPCQPPGVTLGGAFETSASASANVLYAGLAPGYVGLYQLNVQIPASTPAGNTGLYITFPGCWFNMGPAADAPANSFFSNTVLLPVQ